MQIAWCVALLLPLAAARVLPVPRLQRSALVSPSNQDEVLALPGWSGALPSRMFSGYLNISDTKHLHYFLVESERDPANDPVVIWLNGGPGCSSLDGFIYEHGPFFVDPKDYSTLRLRPIHWSQVANVLYIESPVGVGFSYSDRPESEYSCNDDQTANDSLAAVQVFYSLYPQYLENGLFITGESYAGIYVPTLAEAIMLANESGTYHGAELKGIAVGNGCSGSEIGICGWSDQGTYYEYQYLLGHAFVSDDVKSTIALLCNWTAAVHNEPLSTNCKSALQKAALQIGHINLYNVFGDCVGSAAENGVTYHSKAPHKSFLTFTNLAAKVKLTGPDACIDSRAASGYLNRPDVIAAIHVRPTPYTWAVCGTPEGWNYTSTRKNLPRDTYPKLIQKYRVLIFNGDWDACVPFTDNEAWTENMGLTPAEPWHAWTYTTADGEENQVGGHAVKYVVPKGTGDSWFRFITVRGGRHEVPESAPDKALSMLSRLLNNGEF